MARFLLWSDLHLEYDISLPEITDTMREADALLIAGDLHSGGRHITAASELAGLLDMPVILIWGNHELYGGWAPSLIHEEDDALERARELGRDVRVLHGDVTEVAGVRIIGATLWTDMNLHPDLATITRTQCFKSKKDSQRILVLPDQPLNVETWLSWHSYDRSRIEELLAKPFEGKTLVMTHHLPTPNAILPARRNGDTTERASGGLYASDLRDVMRAHPIDVWLYGHSHDNQCCVERFGDRETRVLSNARGYPWEKTGFNPEFMVEI